MLERSSTQTLTSSPVRSESRRRGVSWATAEKKIRKLHEAALNDVAADLTEDESRRLYHLELSASRHAGKSPRHVLEQAKAVLRS
ncbi:hypothetical protein GGP80_003322 [Salinibacter ruber]|uniref:hypothetical protein n=1 Tax=Salinibacter ruber TaxID=146919 RepID=UPI00216910B3|nr:hypothetical protein [Salinibacter ruber]MCS3937312.1 hypothetical protein [Salinibacter ruber]